MHVARHDETIPEEQLCRPKIGIILADGFDEWLNELGVSLQDFADNMMGSWVFNYVQALHTVGVQSVLFCVSTRVSTTIRLIHAPTGSTIIVLPPPSIYQRLKGWLPKDLARGRRSTTGLDRLTNILVKAIEFVLTNYLAMPFFELFKEIRHERCRSLLVQEYESGRFDICVLFGRLKQIPVFATFTGAVPQQGLLRPLRRLALKFCAGTAIGAQVEAKRVRSDYGVPENKVSLVYSPIDLGIFYPIHRGEARAQLGIPPTAKVAIYHGRIDLAYKGLDVLIKAWKLLSHDLSDQDLRLIIVGTGTDADKFGRLVTETKVRGVQWINQWVHDRSAIRRYLSAADIYVFPSRGDACPNAVLEAMACGLPIVASDVNGIGDILEYGNQSAGVLVPPGDIHAFANSLRHLLDDQLLRHELSCRARRRVQKVFSMEVVGKQLSAVLVE